MSSGSSFKSRCPLTHSGNLLSPGCFPLGDRAPVILCTWLPWDLTHGRAAQLSSLVLGSKGLTLTSSLDDYPSLRPCLSFSDFLTSTSTLAGLRPHPPGPNAFTPLNCPSCATCPHPCSSVDQLFQEAFCKGLFSFIRGLP